MMQPALRLLCVQSLVDTQVVPHGSALLLCRVVLAWFPTFNWDRGIWRAIRQVTDPYLNVFTGLVPTGLLLM